MSNRKYFYWVIAVIAFLEMGTYGGAINNINNLFVIPVSDTLGITRGTYSLALSCRSLVAILSNLVMGVFLRRFGYRNSVTVSLAIAAGGFALLATSQNVTMLVLGAVLIGAAEGVCAAGGVARLVGNWFHKHHGLILGVITAATGLGGSVLSIALTALMGAYNWRVAFGFSATCILAVGLLIMILVKDRPESMGLVPYGEGHDIRHKKRTVDDHWHGYTFAQLKKKPSFYVFLVLTFLSSLCIYSVFSVIVPHFQDIGMSKETAAQINSVMLIMLSVGKLLFGFCSDKFGTKPVTLVCLALMILSMFFLSVVDSALVGYITVIVYALALPLVGVTLPLLVPSMYGYGSGSSSVGICLAMVPAANMLGGILSNTLFDVIGEYRPIFFVNIFAAAVITIGYIVLFIWTGNDRKKLELLENSN